ncbi:putative [histone H3]-lysine(4) N-trimethyltransferase [Helianthus anomalus]
MQSLTSALTSANMEFSNGLTYPPGMAPESANKADLENGGVQLKSPSGLWPSGICSTS